MGEDEGTLFDVFLRRDGGDERRVDTVCMGAQDDFVTSSDIGSEIAQRWQALVPKLEPSVQSPQWSLVHLPTYFHSGQPRQMPETRVNVFGFDITVTATGTWWWTFEPGAGDGDRFESPGSRYDDPDPQVQHIYESTGKRTVTVRAEWSGQFSVGDHGPFEVERPATQGPRELSVDVRQIEDVLEK